MWVRTPAWNRNCRDGVQCPMAAWTSRRVAGQASREPAHSASVGPALTATRSASEVGPAQGLSRPERSARLVSSTKRHATMTLKAGHDETAVRNAATASWSWEAASSRAESPWSFRWATDPRRPATAPPRGGPPAPQSTAECTRRCPAGRPIRRCRPATAPPRDDRCTPRPRAG